MQINHPERTRQDENGQWWYNRNQKTNEWLRVYPKICPNCGIEFVGSHVAKTRNSPHCSRSCGIAAINKNNPGRCAGEKGGRWKGGRYVNTQGYVMLWTPDHPSLVGTKRRYMHEHRLVMEKMLGRPLTRTDEIHHRDGNRQNNDPANLELWIVRQPKGARSGEVKHCPTCTCGVKH